MKCRYCGRNAGFLSNYHPECARAYKAAKKDIVELIVKHGTKTDDTKYLSKEIKKLAATSFIEDKTFSNLLVAGWERVVNLTLNQPYIYESNLFALLELAQRLGIPQSEIDSSQGLLEINKAFEDLEKGLVLHDLSKGEMPKEFIIPGQNPFNLQKSEKLIWAFSNVLCREWQMTYPATMDGWGNVRDAHYHWVNADTGVLGITTRHVYFLGLNRGTVLRHNYDTIVMFEPLPDGVGLRFDPLTNFPPMRYATGDGHFTHTLLSALAQRI